MDKQQLYGDYRDGQRWRENLQKQTAHKALDIPVTDELIQVTNNRSGLGWKELLAAAAIGAAGLGGYAMLRPTDPPSAAQPTAPPPVITPPTIQADPHPSKQLKYHVEFFDPKD